MSNTKGTLTFLFFTILDDPFQSFFTETSNRYSKGFHNTILLFNRLFNNGLVEILNEVNIPLGVLGFSQKEFNRFYQGHLVGGFPSVLVVTREFPKHDQLPLC